jgi:hypothetical protein
MDKIVEKYKQLSEVRSDINEHLITLKKYAEECDTVVEMGVRSIVSTWAFLAANPKKLISLDLHNPDKFGGNIQEIYDGVSSTSIDFSFIEQDSLTYNLESCDLLFIDTLHDYLQLKKELTRHHTKVKKYIIFHDTVSFEYSDEKSVDEMGIINQTETNLPKGLWPAIEEFLYHNRNWIIWEKKPNNNGLTILKRIDTPKIETINDYKKVALISSFCDNQEKIDVLEKNIKIIKSHNLDVIVISPFNLPENLTKQCDYFFITKDNPVLDWPTKSMDGWVGLNFNGTKYVMEKTYPDYGFAGLTQIKQLSQIALGLNYNQFFHMIYDIKIDENVIEGFYSNRVNNVYRFKRGDDIWPVGLHFLIFNEQNLKNFISHINLKNYLNSEIKDAENALYALKDKLNYVIEETPVEDEIYFYKNFDFFNSSPIEGIKFFIENDDEKLESIKILFYNVTGEKEIKIKINDTEINHTISGVYLIDLGFNKFNIQPVIIESDNVNYDITEIIKKIKHSRLRIS